MQAEKARAETLIFTVQHGFRVHNLDEYRIRCYNYEIKHSNQPPEKAAFLLFARANQVLLNTNRSNATKIRATSHSSRSSITKVTSAEYGVLTLSTI
jgi:hypothetical protein